MVTRTVEMVERKLLLYDPVEKKNVEYIHMSKKTDKKWDRKIPFGIILELLEEKPVIYKLSMDDDEFFKLAVAKRIEGNEEKEN